MAKWGLFIMTIGSIVMIYAQAGQEEVNARLMTTGMGLVLIVVGGLVVYKTKKVEKK